MRNLLLSYNSSLYVHVRDSGIPNTAIYRKYKKSCTKCHFKTEKQISQFGGKFSQPAWCLIDKTIYQRTELPLCVSGICFGSIQGVRERRGRGGAWWNVYFESNPINKSERIHFLWAQVIFYTLWVEHDLEINHFITS